MLKQRLGVGGAWGVVLDGGWVGWVWMFVDVEGTTDINLYCMLTISYLCTTSLLRSCSLHYCPLWRTRVKYSVLADCDRTFQSWDINHWVSYACVSATHCSEIQTVFYSSLPVYWWCSMYECSDQGLPTEFHYSYSHLFLNVKVGPCCQEVLNHFLVTTEACSPQWSATILQRMCVSIVKVSEVSCHKIMSNMLRE